MLRILIKVLISFLIVFNIPHIVFATNKIIESELDTLNLSSFIREGEKYTKDSFENINVSDMLKSAVSGRIDTNIVYKNVLRILGKEIQSSITIIGGVLGIIVIHAILNSITENLGNTNIGKIAYYVEYILIVTLIMTSFNMVIDMVKTTISNLVGYLNILIPLLLSLIVTSGTAITATTIQPIILALIIFIGNGINLYILPILLISTVLGIVSNLSEKIQISKLANMLKSSIVWVLGFIFTIFVSVLSLEGTLTSSVDGITIKGLKTATSTFIPLVGKVLGDSVETVLRSNFCYKKCSWCYRHNCSSWNLRCSYH